MPKRFVSIWFPYLTTDWFTRRRPNLWELPFVVAVPDHGRMLITAANSVAQAQGINTGMVVADASAMVPSLQVLNDRPGLSTKLLNNFAEYCIRYTPAVAIDPPDGLILDATGCAHIWGGEKAYVEAIITRFKEVRFEARAAMADTIGTAWALARYTPDTCINPSRQQTAALLPLPPAALRLEADSVERLERLGLYQISHLIGMSRSALRRRFGAPFIKKLNQALGDEEEVMHPVQPIEPYQERLPCIEPIVTATGIEIALQRLLHTLCSRLEDEQKGLRVACFTGYRVDGKLEKIEIGTNRPSHNSKHLFTLFELKLPSIEPALGIELFVLEAQQVEDVVPIQKNLWDAAGDLDNSALSELMDRLAGKIGAAHIHRYIPDEHYWPEQSIIMASALHEKVNITWRNDSSRPLQLLPEPERIEVTAPVPDYLPMLFSYKDKLHKISKADGPERIEPEWWIQEGQARDYYCVEDEEGHRYWLFRSPDEDADKRYQWFIHGFFA